MLSGILTVMRGTFVAQLIGIVALPVLTRLHDPEAFGTLQLYGSLLAVLVVGASLRYEVALLRADAGNEAKVLLLLCMVITVLLSALFLAPTLVLEWPAFQAWRAGIPFVPVLLLCGFLATGFMQSLTYWATREQTFAATARGRIAQSSVFSLAGMALAPWALGPSGLIVADVLGRAACALVLAVPIARRWHAVSGPATRQQLRDVAVKFKEFPLVALPGGLVNAMGGLLTPILIYAAFTPAAAGQFALVDRSLGLPVALLVASVSQVYAAQLAAALRSGTILLRPLFLKCLKWMALAGAVPALALLLFAETLFTWIFGAEWRQAGQFAATLAPAYWLLLLSGGTNMTLMVLGLQRQQLLWEVLRLVGMCAIWWLVRARSLPVESAVALHSGVTLLFAALFIYMADAAIRRQEIRQ